MKKETLVAQLEAAKALTPVVSIDNVIALIQQLEETKIVTKTEFKLTPEMFEKIMDVVESAVNGANNLVDYDSAEFELDWNNRINLTNIEVDTESIIDEIRCEMDRHFDIEEEDEETDGFIEAQKEAADSVSVSVINSEVLRQDETE
jgi:hypothetical protein